MPAGRRAPKARRAVERFTCIVTRDRIRRARSGARGPMPQARARKVQRPCDKSMTPMRQKNGTRATKLRFCGSISPHSLVRANPNWGFICYRTNVISLEWTQTAVFSRRISNSLHAGLGWLQTMLVTHAFRGLRNTRKRMACTGTTRTGTTQSGAQRAWAKEHPPHPGAVHLSKKCPAPPTEQRGHHTRPPHKQKTLLSRLGQGELESTFQLAVGYCSPSTSRATASSSASTPAAERSSPPWQNFLSTQPVRIGARIAVMMTAVAIWA